MTLRDLDRYYTFVAATKTMARYISPRLGWRVVNAANTNSARLSPRAGVVSSPATPTQFDPVPSHAPAHSEFGQ